MVKKIISVCNGCCCGHVEKGNPAVHNALFDALIEDDPMITLERPYCLGPCNMANVVKVGIEQKEYWFHHVDTEDDVKNVIAFTKTGKMGHLLKKNVLF